MKKIRPDLRLILGLMLAHILLYITYQDYKVFWYMYTASMLILISYSIIKEELDDRMSIPFYLTYGVLSGLFLFIIIKMALYGFNHLEIPIQGDIKKLYKLYSPSLFWQYLTLMLIVVPGEEIFWRGFVLKRLLNAIGKWQSILLSSLLYASINIYLGDWYLILGTFFAGLFWGWLFLWKRSIPLVIVSHLIFNLFIFILFPLH
ncbi:lysostaphin resistance A-like protein [Pseudoneobacillus sp. C159]